MNYFDALTCEAFILALPQLSESLPDELQHNIRETLQHVADQQPDAANEIRDLVEHHAELKAEYDIAYRTLQQHYQIRERAKGADSLTMNGSFNSAMPDLQTIAAKLLRANNPITAARTLVQPVKLSTSSNSKRSDIWEKGDRLIALAAGGAALGGTLAQIPGAIVGGVLAAAFAWRSSSSAKPGADRNA